MQVTRLLTEEDAPRIAELMRRNREFFAPWDAVRDDSHYQSEGQRGIIRTGLAEYEAGQAVILGILAPSGEVVGVISVRGIVRGAFQSGVIGYWVGMEYNGRGLASTAVAEVKELAFTRLALHRLQAETMPENHASQRVLQRNGFQQYGRAPQYLKIAGKWEDHLLFQVLATDGDR
ncbi:GNAT family N-acetyltransferase [Spiractinospora alimapuensis]|uniref:GNAT family N-acetyltransferase n=1 Tax=Spiractinospora alimapuensis TaxID=2820884 RepID=UPI001F31AE60|nr:GNAT family N-acetyltransferase [Spiractinospora alimapuensis]QVQ51189.1 GNAT family N-acetyltransferase [Spiractinospora alimapuensis]